MHTQVNVEFLTVLFPPSTVRSLSEMLVCKYLSTTTRSEQPSLFFSSVIFLRKYYTWTNILEPPLQYTCSIFILFPLKNWFDGLMNEDHFLERWTGTVLKDTYCKKNNLYTIEKIFRPDFYFFFMIYRLKCFQ